MDRANHLLLSGTRVLDLSRLLPGPFASLVLSDLGAEVVKVEEPAVGDYLRAVPPLHAGVSCRFLAINRDKRSLTLDLKREEGRAALLRLLPHFDILLESFRPGVMERLGLSYAVLESHNPRLVVCSISGYGQTGPYRKRAGHDINYIALAGILGLTGVTDGPPVLPGTQIADLAGGALYAVVGMLAALLERGRSGRGRHLDLSMTEGALSLMACEIANATLGGEANERGRGVLYGGTACYGVYETADGRHLSLGDVEPKFWKAFGEAIGYDAGFGDILEPAARQQEIREQVAARVRSRTLAEWLELLVAADACCEPVLRLDELALHPQHQAREMFFEIDDGAGQPLPQVRTPLGLPGRHRRPPALGEHSAEVLAECGFSEDEIQTLRASGVTG